MLSACHAGFHELDSTSERSLLRLGRAESFSTWILLASWEIPWPLLPDNTYRALPTS